MLSAINLKTKSYEIVSIMETVCAWKHILKRNLHFWLQKPVQKANRAKPVKCSYASAGFSVLSPHLSKEGGCQVEVWSRPCLSLLWEQLGFFLFSATLTWHFNLSKSHQEQRWRMISNVSIVHKSFSVFKWHYIL